MKFFPTFGVMLMLSYMALFLFADALFEASVFVWPGVIALVFTILLCAYVKQSDRIDALEKRIQELEEKKGEQ